MLLYLRDFSDNPPALFAYLGAFLVAFVTGIAFHEFSHAWAANELGDDTAARQGRLTLNPLAHLDPVGTVLLLLVGFGWGKPTPVNPYRLRRGAKEGNALVAAAGPASNFFFAALAALPLRLGLVDSIASFNRIADASGAEIVGLFLAFIFPVLHAAGESRQRLTQIKRQGRKRAMLHRTRGGFSAHERGHTHVRQCRDRRRP